jgi:hypothetical protein
MVAFLLAFTGSDLLPGSITDRDRPPGAPSLDTHAAVGRQITISSAAGAPLIDALQTIATPASSRVDLVVKGFKDGLPRGWFFNRTNGLFQSDRLADTLTPVALRALASAGNELTYTAVPRGSGRRIGIDRDEDGFFDRDELDFGSDPANARSLVTNRPPTWVLDTNGLTLAWVTIPGLNFRVQIKTNLDDPEWKDFTGVIAATNGIVTVNDPAVLPQRFYRLLRVP